MDYNLVKKVSVVMCTYNGGTFLEKQLETIVHQTYPIYEIIIQDDCSTDQTSKIISTYQKKYPIIKFWANTNNQGVNKNFFSALKKAEGEYIAISDQDDIWELNKIERQMEVIGNHLLCFHFSKPFSENGVPVAFDSRIPNYSLMRMIYFNMIPGHTMLMHRRLLADIVDEQCFLYDALLALAAGVQDEVVFINEILVHHRRYSQAYSYHAPVSNAKSISNISRYFSLSFFNMLHNKSSMTSHFSVMYALLLKYAHLSNRAACFMKALRLCDLYRRYSVGTFLQASYLCVKYRDQIFYTQDKCIFRSFIRASIHPLLMFQYYK